MMQQGNSVFSISSSVAVTFSGPFAANQASTVLCHVVGKVVTVEVPAMAQAAAATASAVADTALPANMRPLATVTAPISVISNSVNLPAAGKISIASTGVITIYCSLLQSTAFSAAGNNGWDRHTISFLTA